MFLYDNNVTGYIIGDRYTLMNLKLINFNLF